MRKTVWGVVVILLVVGYRGPAMAGFPANGKLKMQPIAGDRWYYYDEHHWYIKAPDKWQHLMGSYASTKVLKIAPEDDL